MEKYNPTWDLDTLYHGYDDSRLAADLKSCEYLFTALRRQVDLLKPGQYKDLEAFLSAYDHAAVTFSTPETYVLLRSKLEAATPTAAAIQTKIDQMKLLQQDILARLSELLQQINDGPGLLHACPSLAPYKFLLEENQRLSVHRPSPELQSALHAMQATGGRSWLDLHCTLDSQARATLSCPDGQQSIPLTKARGMASSPDPSLRKNAYLAELAAYPSYEIPMAACINGIKGEAIAELSYKHYASVHQEMLDINKMTADTLDSMTASIEKHLEMMRGYLRAKALYLGHKNGLPWYDLLAPLGSSQASYTYDEAHDMLLDAFSGFSHEMAEFIDYAFTHRWIDAVPANGRQSGGICIDLPQKKECRILVNYNGALKDIRTIAHELGHAYHFRCLDHLPLWLRDAPTPICETASTMNETIFCQKCIAQGSKAEQLYLLDANLSEEIQTIMDIYSRYLFEKQVFALRKERKLLPEDLCRMMTGAQKYVFGDALDPGCLHPYMWMNKVHYYIPEFHYYNYPYIFGLLFSKGLYSRYLNDPAGFPGRYKELLSVTCSGSLNDIAAKAGIDITSVKFWDESFRLIGDEIRRFLSVLENQKGSRR